jgi:hypothetical protein
MPVATVRTTVAVPLALPGVEVGDGFDAGVVVVVVGMRFAAAGGEVPTADVGVDVVDGVGGVVRLDPVAELAPRLPLVEPEHPATVTSASDSSAAAAAPAPRLIAHLQCVAVTRRYASSLWSTPGAVRPRASRQTLGRCMLVWMPFAVSWCRTSRTLHGEPRR